MTARHMNIQNVTTKGLETTIRSMERTFQVADHVSTLLCLDWAEQRNSVLESAIDVYKRKKALPITRKVTHQEWLKRLKVSGLPIRIVSSKRED
jgi:hypothetical protein